MKRLIAFFLFFSFAPFVCATPYGFNFSDVIYSKEPPDVHGYQIIVNYDPNLSWKELNLYFDAGFSHFTVPKIYPHSSLSTYSLSPVLRFTAKKYGPMSPFLELSVGLTYLSQTRFEVRNLGIHFAFQDRMGMGILFGKHLSIGIHAVHYSNAHLSSQNSGVSIPVLLDVGYRF